NATAGSTKLRADATDLPASAGPSGLRPLNLPSVSLRRRPRPASARHASRRRHASWPSRAPAAAAVVTSWTAAPVPWPRCRLPGTGGAGWGLLVDEELARAVRRESSLAIQHWWGVSPRTVWCWRRAFGVAQWGTEGSRRPGLAPKERRPAPGGGP